MVKKTRKAPDRSRSSPTRRKATGTKAQKAASSSGSSSSSGGSDGGGTIQGTTSQGVQGSSFTVSTRQSSPPPQFSSLAKPSPQPLPPSPVTFERQKKRIAKTKAFKEAQKEENNLGFSRANLEARLFGEQNIPNRSSSQASFSDDFVNPEFLTSSDIQKRRDKEFSGTKQIIRQSKTFRNAPAGTIVVGDRFDTRFAFDENAPRRQPTKPKRLTPVITRAKEAEILAARGEGKPRPKEFTVNLVEDFGTGKSSQAQFSKTPSLQISKIGLRADPRRQSPENIGPSPTFNTKQFFEELDVPFAPPQASQFEKITTGITRGGINVLGSAVEFVTIPARVAQGKDLLDLKRQGLSVIDVALTNPFIPKSAADKNLAVLSEQQRVGGIGSSAQRVTELGGFLAELFVGSKGTKQAAKGLTKIPSAIGTFQTTRKASKAAKIAAANQRKRAQKSLKSGGFDAIRTQGEGLTDEKLLLQGFDSFAKTSPKPNLSRFIKRQGGTQKTGKTGVKEPSGIPPEFLIRTTKGSKAKQTTVQVGKAEADQAKGESEFFKQFKDFRGGGTPKRLGTKTTKGNKKRQAKLFGLGAAVATGVGVASFVGSKGGTTQGLIDIQAPISRTNTKTTSIQKQIFGTQQTQAQPEIFPNPTRLSNPTQLQPKLTQSFGFATQQRRPVAALRIPTGFGFNVGAEASDPSSAFGFDSKFFRVFDVSKTPFGPIKKGIGVQQQSRIPIFEISGRSKNPFALGRPENIISLGRTVQKRTAKKGRTGKKGRTKKKRVNSRAIKNIQASSISKLFKF